MRWPSCLVIATLTVLTWGSLAFGAVYPWTYWPLLVLCAVSGVLGFLHRRDSSSLPSPLLLGGVLVVAAVLLQLVPLSPSVVATVSPSSDVAYKERQVGEPVEGVGRINMQGTPSRGARALSIDPRATLRGLVFLAALGLLFFGAVPSLDHDNARQIAFGIFMLGVLLAIEGIAQKAASGGRIYGLWAPYYNVTPFGPFVNRNHFAGWMLMAIPLSLGYFYGRANRSFARVGPGWRDRLLWLSSPEANQLILMTIGILLMALSLAMTFSRSGIACFVIALGVMAAVIVKSQTHRRSRVLVVTYVLAVAGLGMGWAGTDTIAHRFADLNQEGAGSGGRVSHWQDAVRVIRAFPLVGTGLNTYAAAMPFYQTPHPEAQAEQAHNDYLQLAAEGGLLLGVPSALLLATLIREARRRMRQSDIDSQDYWIRIGALTGLLSIGLQECVEFSLQMPGNAALFVILWAVALYPSQQGSSRLAVSSVDGTHP